jgi:hypothetical protein
MKIFKFNYKLLVKLYLCAVCIQVNGQVKLGSKIKFIDYYFENGSPLLWKIEDDTLLKISLIPDYQKQTLNRQTDHWYFRIDAEKGTRVRMTIEKMVPDVYNGVPAKDWWNYKTGIPCYLSYDNNNWEAVRTTTLAGKELYLDFVMKDELVYISRLPVYTNKNLKKLLERISGQPNIKILPVGKTIENRELEIIRLGNPEAGVQIIIRARAHPWEPGGNWVVEGMINEFIKLSSKDLAKNICFYILPMANKDGVARGMTRFNTAGMDLNRNWDKPADSLLCPENFALEKFLERLIINGKRPSLVIDLHNDDKGDVHLPMRDKTNIAFQNNMQTLEKLMRQNTSFSESFRYLWTDSGQPAIMSIENGLYLRYNLEAFVYELNANWVTGQETTPSADEWKNLGRGFIHVLYDYFDK